MNDRGGTAKAGDFIMYVKGNNPRDDTGPAASFPGAESPGKTVTLDAGNYSVTEGSVTGYTQIGASPDCSGIIAAGDTKTCTITNDDLAAHLKLVKDVKNDHGGKAKPTDFTLSAAGPTPISGAGGVESDVNAGTYSLSETTLAGYTPGSFTCHRRHAERQRHHAGEW